MTKAMQANRFYSTMTKNDPKMERSNLDLFSIYSGLILNDLHENFPLYARIDKGEYTSRYVDIDSHSLFQKEMKITAHELIPESEGTDSEREEETKLLKKEYKEEYTDKQNKMDLQRRLFDGTMSFLEREKLIRSENEDGIRFQLTAKGFTALNKKFEDGKFTKSSIDTLQEWLKPGDLGVAASWMTQLVGMI